MKIEAFKTYLAQLETLHFQLPDQTLVPAHFHVTEVGKVSKHFVDCGGTVRKEEVINFQLWEADDYDHRLHPEKLERIIAMAQEAIGFGNLEIEVEYQGTTISKYGLAFEADRFLLTPMFTDCLAKDQCGIPKEKPRIKLSELQNAPSGGCDPNSGCC